jgi:hypothetical protein
MFYELQMAGGKIKVSVLCPALTNTRILEAGRNHPEGPVADPAEGTQDRMMLDMLKGIFKTGMLPSETAEIVMDAIRNERFYILTHPEHNPLLQTKAAALVAGGPPPVLAPGRNSPALSAGRRESGGRSPRRASTPGDHMTPPPICGAARAVGTPRARAERRTEHRSLRWHEQSRSARVCGRSLRIRRSGCTERLARASETAAHIAEQLGVERFSTRGCASTTTASLRT